jgi:hypothetical protein
MKRDDPAVLESIKFLSRYTAGQKALVRESSTVTPSAGPFPMSVTVAQPAAPLSPKSSLAASSAPPLYSPSAAQADEQGQLRAVLWFLRRRYAADPTETELPLSSFTDSDIRELLDCFGQELSSMVHKEKVKQTSQVRGGKYVNFEPQFSSGGSNQLVSSNGAPSSSSVGISPSTSIPAQAPYFSRPLSTMTLKDALIILRRGEMVVKYSAAHGKPSYRFLSVRDGRVLFNSELVVMPLLCWSVDDSATPSNQLELCMLSEVRRGIPSTLIRDSEGCLPPVAPGHPSISPACFVSLIFPSRRVDVAFKKKEIADCWTFAFKLVVAKNNSTQGQK